MLRSQVCLCAKCEMMDGCLAVERLQGRVVGLPAFLPSFLPSSLRSDSDLSRIASVGGICIFFFLPLVYHKKISQSHAHLKSSTIQGRVGGRDGNRQDTLEM